MLKKLKEGMIQGLGIVLVVGISGISYAAFNGFSELTATNNEPLTSTKWNNMIDAIQDEYDLSGEETLTSKVWGGKEVYRKIFTYTLNDTNIIEPHNISNFDKIWIEDFHLINPNINFYSTSVNSYYNIDSYTIRSWIDSNNINFYINDNGNSWADSGTVNIIIEYTKL